MCIRDRYNNCIELDLHDEYYNMLSQIEPHMEIVSLADVYKRQELT